MRWIMIGSIAAAAFAWSGAALGACGCDGITVTKSSGSTAFICTTSQLNFSECLERSASSVGCPSTYTWAYQCPTGVNNQVGLKQKIGFQALAAPTGTPSQCESGQALQLSITSDLGADKPNRLATPANGVRTIGGYAFYTSNTTTEEYPDVGDTITVWPTTYPLYGADNYTAPSDGTLIEINDTNRRIIWWDNTDQEKDAADENAVWDYKFISFIEGTGGQSSCACVLDIKVTWDANVAATTTITKDTTNSSNCTVN